MRITFITSKMNLATAGGSVPDLDLKIRAMKHMGHDVRLITVFPKGNVLDREFPYPIIEDEVAARSLWSAQKGVFDVLRRHEAETDLYHVEGQFLYAIGAYRRLGGRIPVVAFFNRELISWPNAEGTNWSFKQRARYTLERLILTPIAERIDGKVFTCPTLKAAYRKFRYHGEPCVIIPDFVDYEGARKTIGLYEPRVEERAAPGNPFTFICSGRMIKEKGFDLVLKAAAKLKSVGEFRIIMSGNGPEEGNLRALAAELGVADRVEFVGWVKRDELFRFLNESDVFILPHWRSELTSVLLLESMAFAIPPIVQSGGGLAWLAGQSGLTFPDGDADALAARMAELMQNDELRVELSRRVMRQTEAFDMKVLAPQLETFMRETYEQARA